MRQAELCNRTVVCMSRLDHQTAEKVPIYGSDALTVLSEMSPLSPICADQAVAMPTCELYPGQVAGTLIIT